MSKGLEALENIKIDMEYVTRLDFVEPIVRGEVQQSLYKIYHRETPELEIIEKELKALEIIKEKPQGEISLIAWGKIKTYEEYLKKVGEWDEGYGDLILTQEEYNLLKEVLL